MIAAITGGWTGFAEKLQSNAGYNLRAFVLFLLPIHVILKFIHYQELIIFLLFTKLRDAQESG